MCARGDDANTSVFSTLAELSADYFKVTPVTYNTTIYIMSSLSYVYRRSMKTHVEIYSLVLDCSTFQWKPWNKEIKFYRLTLVLRKNK